MNERAQPDPPSTPRVDKRELMRVVCAELGRTVAALEASSKATRDGATHEEARPENDKDTRGLEASYLARGQAKRVVETREAAARLSGLALRTFAPGAPIALSALVTVEVDGEEHRYFVVPAAGGLRVSVNGYEVQLITPESVVGRELMNKCAGDELEVLIQGRTREYLVREVD